MCNSLTAWQVANRKKLAGRVHVDTAASHERLGMVLHTMKKLSNAKVCTAIWLTSSARSVRLVIDSACCRTTAGALQGGFGCRATGGSRVGGDAIEDLYPSRSSAP